TLSVAPADRIITGAATETAIGNAESALASEIVDCAAAWPASASDAATAIAPRRSAVAKGLSELASGFMNGFLLMNDRIAASQPRSHEAHTERRVCAVSASRFSCASRSVLASVKPLEIRNSQLTPRKARYAGLISICTSPHAVSVIA